MKKTTRLFALGMALMMGLTGCGKANPAEDADKISESTKQEESIQESEAGLSEGEIKAYGENISVEDIKKAYDYDDSKEMMPLYNVAQTETFEFEFQFEDYDYNLDIFDYVTVHTDAACEEASKIYYNVDIDVTENKTKVTVSPMGPVLATDSQNHDDIHNDISTWGNAPIYYLAVHYDMEATSPVKLDSPIIIPFTVKSEANAPTVHAQVDEQGMFSLHWEPIEGAEKYIIYSLTDTAIKTGENNHPIDGSKIGYDCGQKTDLENQLYFLRHDETTENYYSGFGHSLVYSDITGKPICSMQNLSVGGEFFVTAVVNGKESGLSNPVTTAEYKIPYRVVIEDELEGRYPTPADFPAEVDVLNIDGSITTRSVIYERTQVDFYEFSWEEYDFYIEGTSFCGSVGFDEDLGEPPTSAGSSRETGNTPPEDQVDRIPDNDVETIIPVEKTQQEPEIEEPEIEEPEIEEPEIKEPEVTPDDEIGEGTPDVGDSLISAQSDNTKDHIENGNQAVVKQVSETIYVNAESAEEEWLALNLIQGNTEISVEAFPSLQNPYNLLDVFNKVYYQNPYILGINAYTYDYNTMTFGVKYVYDKETIEQKQNEIAEKAAQVVEAQITADMDTEEKIDTLYNYLVNSSVYDHAALEEAEANGFKKGEGFSREDAFNTYGILVEGKGVCMSYAYAFRLLCDLSDIECIVTTGYLNGNLPHAWNMVNIDGEWYEIDCTNNAVNTGIPYYLFQSDSDLAEKSGYTKDEIFAIDSEVSEYEGEDGSLEYYNKKGLSVEDMEAYKDLITENVNENTTIFAVRYYGEFDKETFAKAVKLAFNELGMEHKLETLHYSVGGGFIVLTME